MYSARYDIQAGHQQDAVACLQQEEGYLSMDFHVVYRSIQCTMPILLQHKFQKLNTGIPDSVHRQDRDTIDISRVEKYQEAKTNTKGEEGTLTARGYH